MNTPHQVAIRYIVFREEKEWYAVALELNIVESADDPQTALAQLFEATAGYIESYKKMKNPDIGLLNQESDEEYEHIWNTEFEADNSICIVCGFISNESYRRLNK